MKKLISVIALIAVMAVLFCACGEESSGDDAGKDGAVETVSLSTVFSEMKKTYEITGMVEFSDVDSLNRFYGIAAEDVKDYAGGINNSGVNQEEIVMILAADADAAARIETALQNRLNSKLSETKNYNAEQYAILEKCNVEKDGNYVSMFLSANAESMKADYRKAIG